MQIDFTKESDHQGVLSMNIQEDDYAQNVVNSLKKYQKTMSFPGFRSGKAPLGLVKKHIGSDLIKEEINKLMVDGVNNYMQEHEKEFIFQPLARESNVDWEKDKEFTFEFTLVVKPDINIDLESLKDITTYKVLVSDDELDNEIEQLRSQYGDIEQLDKAEGGPHEVVVFNAVELDEEGEQALEGGFTKMVRIDHENYTDKLKDLLKGTAKDETLDVDIKEKFSVDELVEIFEADKKVVEDLNPKFHFDIQGAINLKPAELNDAFFESVFGDEDCKTEEDFREKLREQLQSRYANQETNRLSAEVKKHLMENTEVPIPEEYAKEWLKRNAENPNTDDEKRLADFKETAKWDLLSGELADKYEISVKDEEVKASITMHLYAEGMAQYKNQEEVQQMAEQLYSYEGYRMGTRQSLFDTKLTRKLQEEGIMTEEKMDSKSFQSVLADNQNDENHE